MCNGCKLHEHWTFVASQSFTGPINETTAHPTYSQDFIEKEDIAWDVGDFFELLPVQWLVLIFAKVYPRVHVAH